ncbi:MAG: hypothetical protein JNM60_03950 [Candidatus Competibacteraceae bacterium]|nr:hypothetical protein [Candidatus Competibacteraceae bacterium]
MSEKSSSGAALSCLICRAPLVFQRARQDALCDRQECAWRHALLRRQQKLCKVCGRPLALSELPNRLCASLDCQRIGLAEFSRQVAERKQARAKASIEAEIAQATQLHARVMSGFGFEKPEAFPLVVIPAFTAKIVNLPQRRRRNFRDHLTALIAQSSAPVKGRTAKKRPETTGAVPEPAPPVRAALGMACSCCKGRCCEGGADHAYLDVDTLRRYRAAHPEQRPREVLAAYLDRLGPRSYEGSCIFHRGDGCALSRELRSNLCNRHYCKALATFQRHAPATGPVGAFFVAADCGSVRAAALVRDQQMLLVRETRSPVDQPGDP